MELLILQERNGYVEKYVNHFGGEFSIGCNECFESRHGGIALQAALPFRIAFSSSPLVFQKEKPVLAHARERGFSVDWDSHGRREVSSYV
jgi:hypothetical protein